MSRHPLLGQFIVLEGVDGAGKDYFCGALRKYLISEDKELASAIVFTGEPTETSPHRPLIDAKLNTLNSRASTTEVSLPSETETMDLAHLYIADRQVHSQQVREWISPPQNKLVLSTRYDLSTYAYQGAPFTPHQKRTEIFEQLYTEHAYKTPEDFSETHTGCLIPHLTCFLDTTPETSYKRTRARNEAPPFFENQPLRMTEQIRDLYLEAIAFIQTRDPRRILILDGALSTTARIEKLLSTYKDISHSPRE